VGQPFLAVRTSAQASDYYLYQDVTRLELGQQFGNPFMYSYLVTTEPVAQIGAYVDISRRPRVERVGSVIALVFSILCVAYSIVSPKPWPLIALGILLLWDAIRVLSWKLEMTPQEVRVRRYFVWRAIPWEQVRSVGLGDTWGRGQKAVRLGLTSQATMSLGAFGFSFATALCDGLRAEITQRGSTLLSR
jgi:hypothetical protein